MRIECTHYGWSDAQGTCAHAYLLPDVLRAVQEVSSGIPLRILDLGCGNGYVAGRLAELGHRVIGIDASPDGIAIARSAHPAVEFRACSLYDEELASFVGEVDCIVALEVSEHLFFPKKLFVQSGRFLRGGVPCRLDPLSWISEEPGHFAG